MIAGISKEAAGKRANDLLKLIGLTNRADHRPAKLSGGEQQRIAIARALANSPALLIADEPTGNLDPHTAASVFEVLHEIVAHEGLGPSMATHNHELAAQMDRTIEIQDGILLEQQYFIKT